LKPHRSRYWLNSYATDDEEFAQQVNTVCQLYENAFELHQLEVHVVSTDEKTGIQALERINPTQLMEPKQVERREFEYIRHGTQCLISNLEIATGRIIAPSITDTRTEADFLGHIQQTVAIDPNGDWVFIVDQLNTHQSESLVRWVAQECNINFDLGAKGEYGILQSMTSRAAFLQDSSHRIRFVYTPKHTSWLNQIELWFSILVRKLLKRGNFKSINHLTQQILSFIDYFNCNFAKPFKWTYKGRPLVL
jgi:hypothetical protein